MCGDSNNNNNNNSFLFKSNNIKISHIKRIWLLKLLLVGLLSQYVAVVLVNTTVAAAAAPEYLLEDDEAAAADSLSSSSLVQHRQQSQQQQQQHRISAEAALDSSLSAVAGRPDDVVGALRNADEYGDDGDEDDVDVEFAGYLNDFNIQHEASIPEDILDQRHIEDEPQRGKDDDAEEDIILESRRSTSRNFTFADGNNISNNNNTSLSTKNRNYNNNDDYKRKKKKTSTSDRNRYKDFKSNNNEGGDDSNKNNNEHFRNPHETEFQEDNMSGGSITTEEYHQHEQQQQPQHQQQQQNQPLQQHLNIIENLNERKFNKVFVAENFNNDDDDDDDMTWSGDNNNFNKNQRNLDDGADDDKRRQRTAIGDIKDEDEDEVGFRNEDEVGPSQAMATDSDESLAAIGGQTASKIPTTTSSTTSTPTKAAAPSDMGTKFVSRKTKRHGGRRQQLHAADRVHRTADMKTYDRRARHQRNDNNNNNNKKVMSSEQEQLQLQAQAPEQQQLLSQPDYAISYFGTTTNDSSPATESNAEDSHGRASDGLRKLIKDATHSKHFENVTRLSAFEMHKAMRRNNRRTGHKTHKKRYKDYLRYNPIATTPEIATTVNTTTALPVAAEASTTTAEVKAGQKDEEHQKQLHLTDRRQQRIAKLAAYQKDVKAAQKLPAGAAPIFVVSQRSAAGAGRPYYEGQLSYYVETQDDDAEGAPSAAGAAAAASVATADAGDVGKLITSEASESHNNWYGRISPILRNGKPRTASNYQQHQKHGQHHHQKHQHHHQHQHQHHHRQHGKPPPAQHHAYQRRLSNRRLPPAPSDQRQSFPRSGYPPLVASASGTPAQSLGPLPPPGYHHADSHKGALQELGHQITRMEEFDRYYSKWPHLARVQYQLNDEDYRESHAGVYGAEDEERRVHTKPNADYDYRLLDDIDEEDEKEAEEENEDEGANLPPYIKKYNRRNKQLLNLLEGTLAPFTPPARPPAYRKRKYGWSSSVLQPGPVETSAIRIDDDYMKEKRKRYHNRNRNNNDGNGNGNDNGNNKEVFGRVQEQHAKDLAAGVTAKVILDDSAHRETQQQQQQQEGRQQQNHIPDENVDVSSQELDDWEREMETSMTGSDKMKWQIESATTTTTTPTDSYQTSTPVTAPKPARFHRPPYPGLAASGKQFVPNSGSSRIGAANNGNGFVNALQAGNTGNYKSTPRFRAGNKFGASPERRGAVSNDNDNNNGNDGSYALRATNQSSPSSSSSAEAATSTTFLSAVVAKPIINSFVYHRVEASPRFVGVGYTGGRKQRLPFVAITDRRLETSKKPSSLDEQQRDFEQNHYPMP